MEMHLREAGFLEKKEELKVENSISKMEVSQPKMVPEFNSSSKNAADKAANN
jgi:hypothetical protein